MAGPVLWLPVAMVMYVRYKTMRKINISNDSRRDAEVAFGSTNHRQQPVYKTSNGKRSVNKRRVRCTLKTTDEALLNQYGENLITTKAA